MTTEEEARAQNIAAKALGVLSLEGMTWPRWMQLTAKQQLELTDFSNIEGHPLKPFEGCRVEVIDKDCQRRRFWVKRSTGWRPVFLEIPRSNSNGGEPADDDYQSIKSIRVGQPRWR